MVLPKTTGLIALVALLAMSFYKDSSVLAQSSDRIDAKPQEQSWRYPDTRKVDHVDVYHGVKVADPYRWLEDPDSEETRAWVEAQNKVTFSYLEQIPERAAIRERLTKLWNYERYGVPFEEGGRYFFFKNDGLQNQSVLYTTPSLDAEPEVLIDPNTLSTDGTVALSMTEVSPDGKLLAYGVAASGSDWNEYRVRDVATGKDLADRLEWIKFSGASWTPDIVRRRDTAYRGLPCRSPPDDPGGWPDRKSLYDGSCRFGFAALSYPPLPARGALPGWPDATG